MFFFGLIIFLQHRWPIEPKFLQVCYFMHVNNHCICCHTPMWGYCLSLTITKSIPCLLKWNWEWWLKCNVLSKTIWLNQGLKFTLDPWLSPMIFSTGPVNWWLSFFSNIDSQSDKNCSILLGIEYLLGIAMRYIFLRSLFKLNSSNLFLIFVITKYIWSSKYFQLQAL